VLNGTCSAFFEQQRPLSDRYNYIIQPSEHLAKREGVNSL
jgi:hypothetical protein